MPASGQRQQPEATHPVAQRIVVGVDGSDSSLQALRWAVRYAQLTGASVDAVAAWEYPAPVGGWGMAPLAMVSETDFGYLAAQQLKDAVARIGRPRHHVLIRQLVAEGNPARVLLDASADADLLVVGNRGHGGFAGLLLGSVSQHCVHHASCPVVVIRGPARTENPQVAEADGNRTRQRR